MQNLLQGWFGFWMLAASVNPEGAYQVSYNKDEIPVSPSDETLTDLPGEPTAGDLQSVFNLNTNIQRLCLE